MSEPEWCPTQSYSQQNTEQLVRRTCAITCHLPASLHWLKWPEKFKHMVMTILSQLQSQRSCDFCWRLIRDQLMQPFVTAFFLVLICLQRCCYVHLSRHLQYYYWPIKCWFHFLHNWAVQKVKSTFDWLIAMQLGQLVYSLTIHTLETYNCIW